LTLNWWGDQNFKRLRERGAAVEIVSLPWSRLIKGHSIYPFLDRGEAEKAAISTLELSILKLTKRHNRCSLDNGHE
jgi:hypothetical protein